jgi:hypothetical protein
MKDLSIAKKIIQTGESKLVHAITVMGGYEYLDNPVMSHELICRLCGGKEHFTPFIDPKIDARRFWFCANSVCLTSSTKNSLGATQVLPISHRAILWALWCENNGIGDLYHDVKFENIQQSPSMTGFLSQFAANPKGLVLMQGQAGLGKTYASLGTCELFTRKQISAMFMTQKAMSQKWLETFKGDKTDPFCEKIARVSLLVIDDFGTAEIAPGFMSFFMDIINTRTQWSDRGTIVTTNLSDQKFGSYCGESLSDRFNTGQKLVFLGKSRRKPEIF